MIDLTNLKPYLSKTLKELPSEAACGYNLSYGKVRDIIDLDDKLILTTTDRISAFDRVLSTIPFKGQVLNELSLFWFQETEDILPNHILQKISGRSVLVKKCNILPVEFIVRGYLTGSAWRDYQAGKPISGHKLKTGLKQNQRFAEPLITPSTKAERGLHDEPISLKEIVERGIMEKDLLDEVCHYTLELFKFGSKVAESHGLILVDTKYEFGLHNNQICLVDEIHTPDSSRYWYADTYKELFQQGEKQRELDKEYLRQWLIQQGFMGDGEAPFIPDEVRLETAQRYLKAYELISGRDFVPHPADAQEEVKLIQQTIERLKK